MIIISQYELLFNTENGVFVKSDESFPCPLCGGHLISRDSHRRRLIRDDDNSITLQIRRLLCKKCNTLHSELPDIVQPFKHYASSVIQKVLDGRTDDCPAEDTTIRHWIHEFCGVLEEVNAALVSLWIQKKGIHWTLLRQISLLQKIRSRRLPADFPEQLEEAIILRRECPSRSVNDIIRILELEGRVASGILCRFTLQRHMSKRGYGTKQMNMYVKKETVSRRF